VKIAILDDYFDTLRTLACFRKLDGHDVTVWNDHTQDTDTLAERLVDAEVLVLIRERTQIREACSSASTRHGSSVSAAFILTSTSTHVCVAGSSCRPISMRAAVLRGRGTDMGSGIAAMRQIPQQIRPSHATWQTGVGQPARKTLGAWVWKDWGHGGWLRKGLRHEGIGWAREASLGARADGYAVASSKRSSSSRA
jgi:D-3-phosphoglycerate dehydrogenase